MCQINNVVFFQRFRCGNCCSDEFLKYYIGYGWTIWYKPKVEFNAQEKAVRFDNITAFFILLLDKI